MKNKRMKIQTLIGCLALALPCLASADVPDRTLVGEIGAIGTSAADLCRDSWTVARSIDGSSPSSSVLT